MLVLDDALRDMIVQRASAAQLLRVALKDGLRLLRHDGWDKVRAGVTTVEEVLRVSKA